MKKKMLSLIVVAMIVVTFVACNTGNQGSSDYQYTKDGLGYQFIVEHQDSAKPEVGKILTVRMTYGTDDTILYNTDMIPDKVMKLPLNKPEYPGDLYEALGMMHVGDSAKFLIKADSFFLKTARFPKVPPFAQDINNLVFNVKLDNVQTQEEVQKEYDAKMQEMKMKEDTDLQKYLSENNIKQEPTNSGLIFISDQKGSGPMPKPGDKVSVHYTGKLLDGTIFDSSRERNQPFEFTLGQGQVIPGWDEGIGMMHQGGKATLIIPSHLGYGARGAGNGQIPPYATLVFNVELLKVTKGENK